MTLYVLKTSQMKILFIPFFLLTNLFISAQSYAPLGAKWTFHITAFWVGSYPGSWTTLKDTVVLGKKCSLSKRDSNDYGVGDANNKLISYQENGIVYWFNPDSIAFTIFIDFNAVQGDSWTTLCPFDGLGKKDFVTYVDSTDSININGFNLKRLFVHLDSLGPAYSIVEGIGYFSILSPFNWGCGLYPGQYLLWSCDGTMVFDAPEYWGLRCYEDSILGFVDFDSIRECDFKIYVGLSEFDFQYGLKIYPNPATHYIRLNVPDLNSDLYSFMIYNSTGELKLKGDFSRDKETDISQLTSGIYFVLIRSSFGNYSNKFVKTTFDCR